MNITTGKEPTTQKTDGERKPFDIFISYSTGSDYKVARKLEAFIEAFHRTRTGKEAKLRPLQACLDGSDFKLSADEQSVKSGEDGKYSARVPEVIERHLAQCEQMLVLCSPESMKSDWVRNEIRFFLQRRGKNHIRLAITGDGGRDPDAETFFCPEIIEAGLHETVWYDFREFVRAHRSRPKVRDFDSERLRLVADLHGRSASSIETLWQREQRDATRRRYTIASILLIVFAVVGAAAYVQYESSRQQEALKKIADALRHRYSDPLSAIATAYNADPARSADERDQAIGLVHEVLVDRRAIANRRFALEDPTAFSWYSQANSAVFTKLGTDGRRVLLVTEREGGPYSPEKPGEIYLLDNQTLDIVELAPCGQGKTGDYRVEFADFVGKNAILVSRAFYIELYKLDGTCLAQDAFQLRATKTPVTAAGGMLYDVFFVAGNGSGCVWIEEYGNVGLVEPDRELSAVVHCDEQQQPNAVLSILTDQTGRFALNVFQSGHVDLFALDGPNGKPKRRSVLEAGGTMAAFQPGADPLFVIAVDAEGSGASRVETWRIVDGEPQKAGQLPLVEDSGRIDFIGFSSDGRYLIALDNECSLHLWDYENKELLGAPRSFEGDCR